MNNRSQLYMPTIKMPTIRWQLSVAFLLSDARCPLADANYQMPAQFVEVEVFIQILVSFYIPAARDL